jgi:hypothetical protein
MNWYWIFYFFGVADKAHNMFLTFSILSAIMLVVFFFIWLFTEQIGEDAFGDISDMKEKDKLSTKSPKVHKKFMWWFKTSLVMTFLSIAMCVLLPSKKELLLIIAGGSVGEFVTTNEDAKALPADITKFLRQEIMTATNELKDDAKAEVKRALNIDENLEDLTKEQLMEKFKDLPKEQLIEKLKDPIK